MAFDLQQWKEQVRERLRDFAANPKEALKRAGAETLFGYLVGMTVFPLAQAAATGELAPALLTLGGTAGSGASSVTPDWLDSLSKDQVYCLL